MHFIINAIGGKLSVKGVKVLAEALKMNKILAQIDIKCDNKIQIF